MVVRPPHTTHHTKTIMKTSEVLKMLEQMHRDHRPTEEIYAATMRYREFAEAEEAADAEKAKQMPRIRTPGVPPMAPPIY